MPIRVAIRHHTSYSYDRAVKLSPQIVRLRPAPHARNPIKAYSLKISPEQHFVNWQQDPFGNYLARIVFPEKVDKLEIDVEVITDMVTFNPFDFFLEDYAETFPFVYEERLAKELRPYLEVTESGPLLREWVAAAESLKGVPSVDFLVSVNQRIAADINYNIRMEPGVQSCENTLDRRNGSCRDSAWLLVQAMRHFGLAARFVSGYLVQLVADEKPLDGPSGPEQDFTDLHAWAEVYLPGAGWVGLDATSGLFAGEGHIPLAAAPNPESAAPLSGFSEPAQVTFGFANEVERILETPRITQPYTTNQVEAMLRLGDQVDEALVEGDAKLTMGGEPTFVSVDDMESAEWNDAADGTEKRKLAYQLAEKLRTAFAPEGLLHLGEGKWYPGEPLPRWQYAIYWRKDGQALWKTPNLLANPNQDYGADSEIAKAFGRQLAKELRIPVDNCQAAYEDAFYFLWEAGNLPVNISPLRVPPAAKLERKTLQELLEVGLDQPKGYVIPIEYDHDENTWKSCWWPFKREYLFLVPGNSGMGLRLPLDRLPHEVPAQRKVVVPASLHDELPPLPDREEEPSQVETNVDTKQEEGRKLDSTNGEKDTEFEPEYRVETITTALCLEPRDGCLYIFLPPLDSGESFVRLLAAIERTAIATNTPIIIEGYAPPEDIRLTKLAVTPDPGVVEVNIHPADNWREMVNNYRVLFEAARECHLGTNKFMLDGRHTGTGGGNHITLGGTTPAESPLLRRPDLLRSFVNFWQNHPGLSYLFSSAFIGPTSQAPRVDEGRPDQLYELEIAFRELDRHPDPPAYLVDRVFRNLLIDLTGNTHRAEFCIDKLYSPDSASGRLGILELRGFEMPPHQEMCVAQLLLIRALTAAFWKAPYRRPLIRWGNDLHDRFLLHHYVREDLKEVVDYLAEAGFHFSMDWLEPFFAFRFPILGEVKVGPATLEIRSAIEPWHVLGEEQGKHGTARFVDSSVERVQVFLSDFRPERFSLLCNRVEVPLNPAGVPGEYVAAIRYKAWNPPSALHPTIAPDVPLVFDVYDRWNERSVGGCTYHVTHPGGRSYDTFPVNSLEAESRRVNRFWEHNHSVRQTEQIVQNAESDTVNRYLDANYVPPPAITIKKMANTAEFGKTLDLRRAD